MKIEKRVYISVFWVVIGLVLIACGIFDIVDSFWSGMGGALIGVGAIRIYQYIKYRKNPEYREKVEIERNDERNRFIGGRAWAWAGYFFVLINAVGTIAFKIMENDLLSQYCAYSVCGILLLYWVSFLFLRKKY
ncbi:MAG: hypothetical protein IJA17_10050 [Oscillospiraceae bacterium]|nr:hypothetical protein [Oscillospiraceae bacterium]MBQ4643406.1 hypothetical protein [Oscillospiraceae bacterium]